VVPLRPATSSTLRYSLSQSAEFLHFILKIVFCFVNIGTGIRKFPLCFLLG
jgi:hypothetical protein